MKVQSAKANWFTEEGTRLDASFHLSEGRGTKIKILKSPFPISTIGAVTKRIFYGNRSKRIYVAPQYGIPFLGSSDMLQADFCYAKHISKKKTPDLPSYFVEKGWTLVSRSGTIGNTSFTNDDFIGKAFSEHIIRVVPNLDLIKSGYLYAFLASKYGYSLLTQGTFGAVIQHIETHHIAGIPIPLLPEAEQQRIHDLIGKASQLRAEANRLLKYAVERLEFNLPEIQFKKHFSISALEFSKSRLRLDSTLQISAIEEFYKVCGITAQLKTVGNVSSKIFTPNIFKRNRVSNPLNGIPFLSGVNLLEAHPKFDDFLSRKTPNLNDYILREGWLAIQDSGSISSMGYVSLIPKFLDGVSATNNLIRVIPDIKNYNPYIYAFLKTQQGQQILKSLSYGTGQLHIDNNQIECLQVPIYQEIFEDVTEKVIAYKNSFNEAFELESMAINCIESTISSW